MKVLCILNSADGGATQGILELVGALPSTVAVTLVVPSEPEPDRLALMRRSCDVAIVPMTWWNRKRDLPMWYRGLPWAKGALRTVFHARPVSALRALIRGGNFDVVYTGTAMTLDGALAARAAGIPHVWHIKEWVGNHARTRFPLPDRLLARTIGGLSERIIAMSEFIAGPFRDHDVEVDVIPDGVDLRRFESADGTAIRKELEVSAGGVLVAMCASMRATWKRHEVFIDAVGRAAPSLPEARFAIFGSTPTLATGPYGRAGRAYERLRQRATGVGPALTLGRFCSDIPEMMRAIDVLVHPCEIEPFGRIAIEAMAASRPVIGPRTGGIAETVVDGETGVLLPPLDAPAIAEAIVQLAGDADRRARMGSAGRTRAEARYDIHTHADAISGVLGAALQSAGG